MPVGDELSIQTNSELDQHFLSNLVKIVSVIQSAGIQLTDHVVEVGAGVGTVAEHVPVCQSLTVIEYDVNLIPHLRKRVPRARVIQGDALQILPTLRCDVLTEQPAIEVDANACRVAADFGLPCGARNGVVNRQFGIVGKFFYA